MTKLYYWEDDPLADDIINELKSQDMSYRAYLLDAEIPNAEPRVEHKGKTYWNLEEFLKLIEKG